MIIDDNEKDKNADIKKQAQKLELDIKEAEKELETVKDKCNHPAEHRKIKDTNPEGSSDLKNTCDLCGHEMGYPSKEELDKYFKKPSN